MKGVAHTAAAALLISEILMPIHLLPGESPADNRQPWTESIEREVRLNAGGIKQLEELCDRIGPRLTGSPQEKQAREWAIARMRAIGLDSVHEEPWQMARGWERLYARAEIRLPAHQSLTMQSLGWSGSTPLNGVEADVLQVKRDNLLPYEQDRARWRGKILFLTSGGKTSDVLSEATRVEAFLKEAHAAGAVAVIDGETSSEEAALNLTHIDLAAISGDYVAIPVVRMPPMHYEWIQRLISHQPVRLWLDVQNRVTPGPQWTANVIGDIPGTKYPDEIVVVSAHLDSWDLAQGASDDGFGVAAVLAASEAIIKSGYRPDRTIRILLTTGEEQGIRGSAAYVHLHRRDLQNHTAALFSDMGDGLPVGFLLNGRDDLVQRFTDMAKSFPAAPPYHVDDSVFLLGDSFSFSLAGVAAIDLSQKSPDLPYTHHTITDTFDRIQPANLTAAAEAMALSSFGLACLKHPMSAQQSTSQITERMKRTNMLQILKLVQNFLPELKSLP